MGCGHLRVYEPTGCPHTDRLKADRQTVHEGRISADCRTRDLRPEGVADSLRAIGV